MNRGGIATILGTALWLFQADVCVAEGTQNFGQLIQISAQPLSRALQAFGRVSGLQVVYRSELVRGMRSAEVTDSVTADEALARLLAGTGLTYRYLDNNTITIVPLPRDALVAGKSDAPGLEDGWQNLQKIQLEEVIVTAQKTTEMASKTPLALSVYSGRSLHEHGISSVFDLQDLAPSMYIGRAGTSVNLAIRGVTTTDITTKGDQNIAFTVDSIPLGRPIQMGLAFFDLERVEVLRGPQGTLYGKSSTGGVINLITNKPKDQFEASADLEVGSHNARRGNAMVNVPISNRFAVRLAGNFNVRDGYLDPVLGNNVIVGKPESRSDQDDKTGRLTALWKFGDTGSLTLTALTGTLGGAASVNALVDVSNLAGSTATGWTADAKVRNGPARDQIYFNPYGSFINDHFHNYNAELNLDFGAVHMTYDVARLTHVGQDNLSSANNPAGRPISVAGTTYDSYQWVDRRYDITVDSHELRFSNAEPGRLEWVAGVNYFWEVIDQTDAQWNVATSVIPTPSATPATPGNHIISTNQHRSNGVFGQANIHVTNALTLTLGARHSTDSVARVNTTFASGPVPAGGWPDVNGNRPCAPPNLCVGVPRNGLQEANKVTWRIGADYLLSENEMIYASVATGYKAGGFNDFGPLGPAAGSESYVPEDMIAYEAGYKGELLPNLRYTTALFYYDFDKFHVNTPVQVTPTQATIFTRAAPVKTYGWENEVRWLLTDADSLDASLTFQKGTYGTLMLGLNRNIDWTGREIPLIPDAAASLSYAHRWFIADGGYVEARASSRYNSGYRLIDLNTQLAYAQESFTRSDLSLSYNSESGTLNVQAFVRNIEDDLQFSSTPAGAINGNAPALFPAGSANAAVTDPRTYGIRVGVKY